jgi:hypothetical protein
MVFKKGEYVKGQFVKGQSGNPSGLKHKPNKAAGMAREYTEKSIQTLVDKLSSSNEMVQVKAAVDRDWETGL